MTPARYAALTVAVTLACAFAGMGLGLAAAALTRALRSMRDSDTPEPWR